MLSGECKNSKTPLFMLRSGNKLRYATKLPDAMRGELDEPVRLCSRNLGIIADMDNIKYVLFI